MKIVAGLLGIAVVTSARSCFAQYVLTNPTASQTIAQPSRQRV